MAAELAFFEYDAIGLCSPELQKISQCKVATGCAIDLRPVGKVLSLPRAEMKSLKSLQITVYS